MPLRHLHNIHIGQDANKVSTCIKKKFNLIQGLDTSFKAKQQNQEVYDFVGLINSKDSSLAIFPKHFYSDEELFNNEYNRKEIYDDIQLLFQTIYKYISKRLSANATLYAGEHLEFDSDYPFYPFFSIYKYFQQFGVYVEKYTHTKIGYNSKISWKETIRRSSKVFSSGNIIHIPLYINQSKTKQVFISDCMSFAINYTLERFSFLFRMPKTNNKFARFDFLNNIDFIILKLQSESTRIFKDIDKKLIQDLINFYKGLELNKNKGGDFHVKIKYFNLVWEEMIEEFLNKHFVGVQNNSLFFNINQSKSKFKFSKGVFEVDQSANKYKIEPDHHFIDEKLQFIFDAKYYSDLNHLDYKQFSYHEMLKNKTKQGKTISALIVPSANTSFSEIHFLLRNEYVGRSDSNTKILLQKLKIKDVMKSYINNM